MRRYLPVLVLFILSPLVAELLFGATPITRIGGLLPTSLIYGGGAVLIREVARRRGPGWWRIALLGAAYGIVEEGLAIQSLFNPDLFNAGVVGGRAFGVNWLWSEWTVGYHVVWSICVPILLAELLFPARRAEPWLGKVGVAVAAVIYVIGAALIGVVYRLFLTPDFRTPLALNVAAALVALVVAALALLWPAARRVPAPEASQNAPSPWLVGIMVAAVALAWFALLDLPHALRAWPLAFLPILGDLALVAVVAGLLRRWSARPGWGDLHRLAVVFGALPVSMGLGFLFVTAGSPVDQIGQGALSLVALALLTLFAVRLRRREGAAHQNVAVVGR